VKEERDNTLYFLEFGMSNDRILLLYFLLPYSFMIEWAIMVFRISMFDTQMEVASARE